jgi:hypothetical protein
LNLLELDHQLVVDVQTTGRVDHQVSYPTSCASSLHPHERQRIVSILYPDSRLPDCVRRQL